LVKFIILLLAFFTLKMGFVESQALKIFLSRLTIRQIVGRAYSNSSIYAAIRDQLSVLAFSSAVRNSASNSGTSGVLTAGKDISLFDQASTFGQVIFQPW